MSKLELSLPMAVFTMHIYYIFIPSCLNKHWITIELTIVIFMVFM